MKPVAFAGAVAASCLCVAAAAQQSLGRPAAPTVRPLAATVRMPILAAAGRPLAQSLQNAGLSAADAGAASAALAEELDIGNVPAPVSLDAVVTAEGPPRLLSLALAASDGAHLVLTQAAGGRLTLRRTEPVQRPAQAPPRHDPPAFAVLHGVIDGSLYLSMAQAGAAPDTAARAVNLLGHRIDLSRDVRSGDAFVLVLERAAGGAEAQVRYVEVAGEAGPVRLYGLRSGQGGALAYVDADGARLEDGLMRTPVDATRISSGFGARRHPILGFTRMHEGIDFAAPAGTPVYAAAAGIVEDARWSGGYGRWVRLGHGQGLETGYGHLSAYGPGIRTGAAVRQGDLIGYVGSSGLATGPHLHYEVIRQGHKIDPSGLVGIRHTIVQGGELPALRARVAGMLESAGLPVRTS